MTITRRTAVTSLFSAATSFALPAAAQFPIPFKVGMSAPANTYLAIWMADQAGFYKANGLAYETLNMTGGAQAGPTLSSGQIQVMHIGLSSVIRANGSGADLRAIGSLSNVIRFTLFARPGVTNAAQLKGGVFGISSAGSESDVTITLALEKIGLTRNDISVKDVGSGGQRLEALRSGVITAAALNEPYRTQAFEAGLTPIVDLVPDQTPWIFSGLVADAAYIKSSREALLKFLRATIEGNYLAITNEARGKEVLSKVLKITDQKVLDLSYSDFRQQTPLNAEISREGALRNIALVASSRDNQSLEDYCDFSFAEELRREGFVTAMQTKYGVK